MKNRRFIKHYPIFLRPLFFFFIVLAVLAISVKTKAETTVTVGYYESGFFQEGMSDSSKKSGYGYEYLQEISYHTGWKYKYVYGNWTEIYDKFLRGEIDLLGGVSKTEDRMSRMYFPESVMGSEMYYIYKHTNDTKVVAGDYSSYSGRSIGVVRNNVIEEALLQWISKNNVALGVKYYDSFVSLEESFRNNEVELICFPSNDIQTTYDIVPLDFIGESDYYLCASINHEDYAQEIDRAYLEIYGSNSNFLTDLKKKYYTYVHENVALSEEEIAYLKSKKQIIVGCLDDYLPISDSSDGRVTGLVSEIAPEIFKTFNLESVPSIVYISYASYDELVEALHNGKIDLCFPVSGGYYYAEQDDIYISNGVINVGMNLIYSGNYSDDKLNTIAVNANNKMQYYYILNNFPDAEIIECQSIEECLDAVMSSKATATVINSLRSSALLSINKYVSLNSIQLSNTETKSFAVASGNTILLQIINHGLSNLPENYSIDVSYKYISGLSVSEYTARDFFMQNLVAILIVTFGVSLTIILLILFFLRKTKAEENRTLLALMMNESLSRDYVNIFLIDCGEGTIQAHKMNGENLYSRKKNQVREYEYFPFCEQYINSYVYKDDKRMLHEAMKLDIVLKNTKDGMDYVKTYRIFEHNEIHYFQFKYTMLNDSDNIIVGFQNVDSVVVAERNNQKALEDALETSNAANRAKTLFLNNMSHDIRTPMNAIIGYTSLASTHLEEKDKVKDYLEKISTSSNHLLSLINDVLDMSRIESGKVHLEEDVVHLPSLIDELKTIQHALVTQKNITLKSSIRIVDQTVVCDKLRINQILLNILGNAVKFTPENGRIDITVFQHSLEVSSIAEYEFKIKDNGIGMDKSFLVHIFEPFTRERTSTVSGIQGTGLGMAITKNLVDMMNGTISVESEAGKGTEFTVRVPFQISKIAKNRKDESNEEGYSFIGRSVLLVDDNELNREIATEILKEYGFVIDEADDGSVAVDKIKKSKPGDYDFILMDIQMPKMNGYDATRAIRSIGGELGTIPIIAMTANAFEEDKQLAYQAGMNGHVAKPIDIAILLDTINRVVK